MGFLKFGKKRQDVRVITGKAYLDGDNIFRFEDCLSTVPEELPDYSGARIIMSIGLVPLDFSKPPNKGSVIPPKAWWDVMGIGLALNADDMGRAVAELDTFLARTSKYGRYRIPSKSYEQYGIGTCQEDGVTWLELPHPFELRPSNGTVSVPFDLNERHINSLPVPVAVQLGLC